jgi:hypothetical protein
MEPLWDADYQFDNRNIMNVISGIIPGTFCGHFCSATPWRVPTKSHHTNQCKFAETICRKIYLRITVKYIYSLEKIKNIYS